MSETDVELGAVQETLLVPLYGRASLTREGNPLISDPKAVDIVEALDYDFSRFDGSMSLIGSVLRTRIFDHWVARWLEAHPAGTVVEIGAGLNTRYERLDNGRARWFELDLPDVLALRRRFFADTERRTMLAGSVLDDDWVETVAATPGPWLFAAEAVLIYLPEPDVRRVVSRLTRRFPGSLLALDTWGSWMRDHQEEHDAIGQMDARFEWFCDDLTALSDADAEIVVKPIESCTFTQAPAEVLALLPPPFRDMLPALADDPQMLAYRQNLVRLDRRPNS
jgi:O-methyltransferase involved in polyketide biosynthesis